MKKMNKKNINNYYYLFIKVFIARNYYSWDILNFVFAFNFLWYDNVNNDSFNNNWYFNPI